MMIISLRNAALVAAVSMAVSACSSSGPKELADRDDPLGPDSELLAAELPDDLRADPDVRRHTNSPLTAPDAIED